MTSNLGQNIQMLLPNSLKFSHHFMNDKTCANWLLHMITESYDAQYLADKIIRIKTWTQ